MKVEIFEKKRDIDTESKYIEVREFPKFDRIFEDNLKIENSSLTKKYKVRTFQKQTKEGRKFRHICFIDEDLESWGEPSQEPSQEQQNKIDKLEQENRYLKLLINNIKHFGLWDKVKYLFSKKFRRIIHDRIIQGNRQ